MKLNHNKGMILSITTSSMAKYIIKGKHDMASSTTYTTTEITADETDRKQLQLHTHKVQAKSTCKFGAHDKRLACLGVGKYSGKKCEMIAKRFAGNSSFSEGAV